MRRTALLVTSSALLLVIVAQFYFAAFGAFGDRDATGGFAAHEWVARTALPVLSILLVVAAAVGRWGRRLVGISMIPLLVIVVQFLLFFVARAFGSETHPGGATGMGAVVLGLHALFGLLALVAATHVLHTAWSAKPAGAVG